MSNESENKLARRVDDKRAEVPLQWNEAAHAAPAVAATAASQQPAQREVPEFTGLEAMARVFADVANDSGKVVLSAQSCDLLYRAMTTPIVAPIDNGILSDGVVQAEEAKLYRYLTGDAMKLGYDGIPAALEALRTAGAAKGGITSLKDIPKYEWWLIEREGNEEYVKVSDVERLLASTAGEQAEPNSPEFDGISAAPASPEQVQAALVPENIAGVNIARLLRNLEETSYNEGVMDLACRLSDCNAVIKELLAAPIAAAPAAEEVRDEALLEAMAICDQKYEARIKSGHPREASTARALSDEINAIRAMKRPASTEGGAA